MVRFLSRIPRTLVLTIGALLVVPAAGASERVETMLQTVRAAPFTSVNAAILSFVDLTATYEVAGFDPAGADMAATLATRDARYDAFFDALFRIQTPLPFMATFLQGGAQWKEWLGADFLDMTWSAEVGDPPRQMLYLGLPTAPLSAAIEAALLARGLTPVAAGGLTVYSHGAEGEVSPAHRLAGYPFSGELGSADRIVVLPDALVGSRFTDATVAAASGPVLADDPALAAGIRAVDDPALPGQLLQFMAVRQDFSPEYVKALMAPGTALDEAKALLEKQAPGPLPAFSLLVVGQRTTANGEETLVALVYDQAADAAIAAQSLPLRLAAYQPIGRQESLQEMLGAEITTSVVELEGKSVVRLHLATPAPADKRQHALTYRRIMEGLYRRDIGWLTWK